MLQPDYRIDTILRMHRHLPLKTTQSGPHGLELFEQIQRQSGPSNINAQIPFQPSGPSSEFLDVKQNDRSQ
jgi:hypothetical protein